MVFVDYIEKYECFTSKIYLKMLTCTNILIDFPNTYGYLSSHQIKQHMMSMYVYWKLVSLFDKHYIIISHLIPLPRGAGRTVPHEGFKADMSSYKPPPYFVNIKSIAVQRLLWMNDMLDFIL